MTASQEECHLCEAELHAHCDNVCCENGYPERCGNAVDEDCDGNSPPATAANIESGACPAGADISSSITLATGSTFTFSRLGSVPGEAIVIAADNATLDCGGSTLNIDGFTVAIRVNENDNVTVKNCVIVHAEYGIIVRGDENSVISGNSVSDCYTGILVAPSSSGQPVSAALSNNNVQGCTNTGIALNSAGSYPASATIENNTCCANNYDYGCALTLHDQLIDLGGNVGDSVNQCTGLSALSACP